MHINISIDMEVLILLLLASFTLVTSQTIVETLPGYPGSLPFKLETGYIGVGEDEAVQLFYYFVESERNPLEDPLVIWLSGGPGCTTLHAFFYEIGPLKIVYGKYIDNVPALQLDPYSWTKTANVIYLEAPTVTGYSYTKTPEAIRSSDTASASQTTEFIRKFLRDHPKFLNNTFYVTGISYSGIVIPIVTEELYKGNDEGLQPIVNIQGYIAGNPLTDKSSDINSRFEFSYHMGLISEELYESARKNCDGDYAEADSNNLLCLSDIDEVNKRVEHINSQNILDPDCDPAGSLVKGGNPTIKGTRKSHLTNPIKMFRARSSIEDTSCDVNVYDYAAVWANDKDVMKALGVREETVKEFLRCNVDMTYSYGEHSTPLYEFNVQSSVVYHEKLRKRNCRALIFSGDHDLVVPYSGTLKWVKFLNLTTTTDSIWDAWYANGQVAGYKTTYARDNYTLVFATLKGAGHTASEDKHSESFEMIKRWFAYRPI